MELVAHHSTLLNGVLSTAGEFKQPKRSVLTQTRQNTIQQHEAT